MSNLADQLDGLTVQGELYETLPDGAVRCYACGHRCLIRNGRRGICQVRFNRDGRLMVPWGYVAALQSDPIEKKPFFHLLPGTDALTFGMLGCDFHCSYCFPGETIVISDQGPISLSEAFDSVPDVDVRPDAEIAYPRNLRVVTRSSAMRSVRAIFKHKYYGKLVTIKPFYLPKLSCTPDHRLYATKNVDTEPELIPARELTTNHFLVIPRNFPFISYPTIDTVEALSQHKVTYLVRWKLSRQEREAIALASKNGVTSREIGASLGKDSSYIRHVRGKLARGVALEDRTSGLLLEETVVRFPNEHKPGIPASIQLDEKMAELLGFYCAEGSVVQSKKRPNSLVINFSFSPHEAERVEEIRQILKQCLGVNGRIIQRSTTLSVSVSKASAALLFKSLAGSRASEKRVPKVLFSASREITRAFIEAYVDGDGHRFANGKISVTTVSRALAFGVAWLVLKLGYFPSLYETPMPRQAVIQGRRVSRQPYQYTVVWYENSSIKRKIIEQENYYLVPLRAVTSRDFDGFVYNMEVEEEHNYLAGFFLVSNCQNWLTSQAMRDPASDIVGGYVREVSPEQMVALARRSGAGVIASSYNEPLITSEWAVAIFREAQAAGLKCVYISNGNATPEVLSYLRPYIIGYKIDLKTMQDRHYRKLGGVLAHVLDSIRLAHEMGLWVEVVTLTIPGFNDSSEELMDAARFIASVSRDIPWHVTAFHPDYKMTDPAATTAQTLIRAAEIGQEAGLNYVYAGNLPGRAGDYEHTYCPNCQTCLIERYGYIILSYRLTEQGTCPKCGTTIPGFWTDQPDQVHLGGPGMPRLLRW